MSQLTSNITLEEWIVDSVQTAVHLNDNNQEYSIPKWRPLKCKKIPFILPKPTTLSYKKVGSSPLEHILQILCLKSIRRGAKHLIAPFIDEMKSRIEHSIVNKQPIPLVLPSLPFKDQSPFGTEASIDHVDLGEYCYFAQIHRILQAIKSVYDKGAHLTILCDGLIFADMFVNGDADGAGRYKAHCEALKNAYGLYNEVSLIDMKELFFHSPGWEFLNKELKDSLWKMYDYSPIVKQRIDHLANRFIYYVKIPNMSYEEVRHSLIDGQIPHTFLSSFRQSAIDYIAIHLTLKKLDIIQKRFPFALRCTVHPKHAPQIPLHTTNKKNVLLPYNGVPLVSKEALSKGKTLFEAVRIRRLYEVFNYQDAHAVYLENGAYPFYYEIP